jgi:hypothetical protein
MPGRQRRTAAPGTAVQGRLDRAAFEAEFPGTSGSAAECTVLLVRAAESLPDPADRRRVLIGVTADGRALVDAFLPEMAALQAAVCEPLGEAERNLLLDLLGVLDEQARTVDPEAVVREAPVRRRAG